MNLESVSRSASTYRLTIHGFDRHKSRKISNHEIAWLIENGSIEIGRDGTVRFEDQWSVVIADPETGDILTAYDKD